MRLRPGERVLFIGDSITSAGRLEDPAGLGFGYVRLVHDLLCCAYPAHEFSIINRGIGGDTIRDLAARWERDAIEVAPDRAVVSIGVNDVWRQWPDPAHPEGVPLEEFEETYDTLLRRLFAATGCALMLCEPTIIGERRESPHYMLLQLYLACVHRLAEQHNALMVPMNQRFWQAIDAQPERSWTNDGVHPLSAGHMLMARTFFESLGGLEGCVA